MDLYEMDYTKRVRVSPSLPSELMRQLQNRMTELGQHKNQHLHMGQLTWLFTHRGWVMVSKPGSSNNPIYPPDKTLNDVLKELGEW